MKSKDPWESLGKLIYLNVPPNSNIKAAKGHHVMVMTWNGDKEGEEEEKKTEERKEEEEETKDEDGEKNILDYGEMFRDLLTRLAAGAGAGEE